jgi:hypothetical protein
MALDGQAPPAAPAPAASPAPAWYESLPANILNDDIKAFKGPDELAKAYIDTKGKVPVVPDKYEFTFPKGLDAKEVEAFNERAKKIGLTQDQYAAFAQAELDVVKAADEAFVAQKKEVLDGLRKEWGASTDANVVKAEAVAKSLFGEEYLKEVGDLKQVPMILKGLYYLSTKLGEDTLKLGGGVNSNQPVGPDGTPRLKFASMGD